MKYLIVVLIAVFLVGCVGADGRPVEFTTAERSETIYADGLLDGCMAGMLLLTRPENLPPYKDALDVCKAVTGLVLDGQVGDLPSQGPADSGASEELRSMGIDVGKL